MARKPIVEFDQTPDTHFFLCRACGTHTALLQEVVFVHRPTRTIIVENAENVLIDNFEPNVRAYTTTVAATYCVGFFTNIGFVFVEVDDPNNVFQCGRTLLNLYSPLYWNGHQIIDPTRT